MESNFDKLYAITDKFKQLVEQQKVTIDELLVDKVNLIQETIDLKKEIIDLKQDKIELLEEKEKWLLNSSEIRVPLHNKIETLINRVKTRIIQLKEYKQEYIKEERWMEVSHNNTRILILEMMLDELKDLLK